MEVTMLIQKLSVKHSTSALLMVLEVLPSTVSSAPMELSSTRTTSSVTGGSTLTALKPRVSIASMINTLLREMLLLVLLVMLRLSTLVLKVLVLELDVRDLQDVEEEDRDSKHWPPPEHHSGQSIYLKTLYF